MTAGQKYTRKMFVWPAILGTLINPALALLIYREYFQFYLFDLLLIPSLVLFLAMPLLGWIIARPAPFALLAVFGILFAIFWLFSIIAAAGAIIEAVSMLPEARAIAGLAFGVIWLCYPIWIRLVWKAAMLTKPYHPSAAN